MGLVGKPYILRDPADRPYLDIFGWILASGRCPIRFVWRSIWTNSQHGKCHMDYFSTTLRNSDFATSNSGILMCCPDHDFSSFGLGPGSMSMCSCSLAMEECYYSSKTKLATLRDQTKPCKIYEHRFSAQPHMLIESHGLGVEVYDHGPSLCADGVGSMSLLSWSHEHMLMKLVP